MESSNNATRFCGEKKKSSVVVLDCRLYVSVLVLVAPGETLIFQGFIWQLLFYFDKMREMIQLDGSFEGVQL